jgi:hypothetical protein
VTALDGTALETMNEAERTISLEVNGDGTVVEGVIPGTGADGDEFVAFRITLENADDPATAKLVVEQFLPIDHGPDEVSLLDEALDLLMAAGGSLDLTLTTTLVDGDGDEAEDSASVTLIDDVDEAFVTFEDDGPSQLLPDDAVVLNLATSTDIEELNFVSGTDGVGGFIFLGQNGGANESDGAVALDKDGTAITSNELTIFLFGFDTDTLVASTDIGFNIGTFDPENPTDDVVYVVTLNSAGTYDVVMHDIIDGGQTTSFPDLTGTGPAGNITFKVIEGTSGTEILVQPLTGGEVVLIEGKTINSDSNDIGVSNQWISDGDGIQIDIGEFTVVDPDFTVESQLNINSFEFAVFEVTGGPSITSNIKISVFDDDVVEPNENLDNGVQDALTVSGINVKDGGTDVIIAGVVQAGFVGDVDIYADADGSIYLIGMMEDWIIEVDGEGDTFNQIRVEDARLLILKGDSTALTAGTTLAGFGSLVAGDELTITTDLNGDTSTFIVGTTGTTLQNLLDFFASDNDGIDRIELADDGSLVIFLSEDATGPSDMTLSDDSGSDLWMDLGLSEDDFSVVADDWSFGGLEFQSGTEGGEVTLNYDIEGTDGDGDAIAGDLDIVVAPNAGVTILGTDGVDDPLNGTASIDFIYGLDGDDVLSGGDGDDQLDGGKGADDLTGGMDADVFVWASLNDIDDDGTGTFDGSVSAVDTITDFRATDFDTLDISDLLADIGDAGNINGSIQVVLGAGDTVEVQVDLTGTGVGTFETFVVVENIDTILQADLLTDVQLALTVV